jgi:hypothetical protein
MIPGDDGSQKLLPTTRKLARGTFVLGVIMSVFCTAGYSILVMSISDWNPATVFQTLIILWGLGFMFPCFFLSMRLMLRTHDLSIRGLKTTEDMSTKINDFAGKAGPIIEDLSDVVQEIGPIVENVSEVVGKARGMSDDVEKIAQTIRSATDRLNGSLESVDFKKIEGKLEDVASSLQTIAGVFSPMTKGPGKKRGLFEGMPVPMPGLKKAEEEKA